MTTVKSVTIPFTIVIGSNSVNPGSHVSSGGALLYWKNEGSYSATIHFTEGAPFTTTLEGGIDLAAGATSAEYTVSDEAPVQEYPYQVTIDSSPAMTISCEITLTLGAAFTDKA